jgi:hypothetical protein
MSFLSGDLVISLKLLQMVNIRILQHIFDSLTERNGTTNQIKQCILRLMIERCKEDEVLEGIGGVGFFKRVIDFPHPEVA